MHSPIKPKSDARTITAAEVRVWFVGGPKSKPWPSEALCAEVAARLTKFRWASEWPSPEISDEGAAAISWDNPWTSERECYPCWDSEEAAHAAKALLKNIPAMLAHYSPMRQHDGYDAIERFRVALDAAIPFIEFPFGKYDRDEARKRQLHPKHPKPWHASAIPVARVTIDALRRSGHTVEGTSHNTITVRIVRDALVRMGFDDIEKPAIAKVLTKWADEHGQF